MCCLSIGLSSVCRDVSVETRDSFPRLSRFPALFSFCAVYFSFLVGFTDLTGHLFAAAACRYKKYTHINPHVLHQSCECILVLLARKAGDVFVPPMSMLIQTSDLQSR